MKSKENSIISNPPCATQEKLDNINNSVKRIEENLKNNKKEQQERERKLKEGEEKLKQIEEKLKQIEEKREKLWETSLQDIKEKGIVNQYCIQGLFGEPYVPSSWCNSIPPEDLKILQKHNVIKDDFLSSTYKSVTSFFSNTYNKLHGYTPVSNKDNIENENDSKNNKLKME